MSDDEGCDEVMSGEVREHLLREAAMRRRRLAVLALALLADVACWSALAFFAWAYFS